MVESKSKENQKQEDMVIPNMKVKCGWHVTKWVLQHLQTLSYVLNVKNSLSIQQKMNILKDVNYAIYNIIQSTNTVCLTLWSRTTLQEN